MKIYGEAIVSCYVNAASLLMMVLLLLLSKRFRKRGNRSIRIFYWITFFVTIDSILLFLNYAMYMQTAPWCHTVAMITKTACECLTILMVAQWLFFVDNKLYGIRKRYSISYKLVLLPFVISFILLMVNPFTEIVFTYSSANKFEHKTPMLVIWSIEFLYLCSAAAFAWYFDRKTMKIRLLHVSPMIFSVALVFCAQLFLPYQLGILGFAVGVMMMYFSMVDEMRFVDDETGLYNKTYLAYLFDMALAGKNDVRCALILTTEGNLPASVQILLNVLHENGDVIRLEENRFLMLSKDDSYSTVQYLSSLMAESVDRHNSDYPDKKVQISVRCRMRSGEEDSFKFLQSMMDNKEAGDEMRGVVSMISELDRLDKELKLAADIQISTLPMVFPPFPDRTEFDLYATMIPAKEVGGDFYDFFLIDNDHLGLVIADVSGKGIPAALFMMVSKTLIKNQLMSGYDPATALEHVNLQLCERNSSMMFVTVWLAVLEISTGKGMVCNAGHENPGIRRSEGDFELLKYKHDMFIGVNGKAKYQIREFELHPGDCVFVYTDGVPESSNKAGEMFGGERLVNTLNQNANKKPQELIQRMNKEIDRFVDGAPQFDDITMLCLKYNGAPI